MTVENEKLLKVIKDIRLTVLADNRVDADEARELLRIAERYAPEHVDMARFASLLKDILADGIVDRGESRRIADYLNWLVRETVADEPEQGVLGKVFGFNRNRADVRSEVVAGITAFLAMSCAYAMSPSALVSALGFDSLLALATSRGPGVVWRVAFFTVVFGGLAIPMLTALRKVPCFAVAPSTLKKTVTAVIGLVACFVAGRMAFASGNGAFFCSALDVDQTWRTILSRDFLSILAALLSADCLMSLFAVLAGGRTIFASVIASVLFALALAFAPTALAIATLVIASGLFVVGCFLM